MLFLDEGFSFRNFLVDVFTVFVFIAWFWLLITVFMDLFRRHDTSGWAKAIWVIALIIFPLLAVLAYLITQSRGMAERNTQQAQQARDELRRVVGFSAADEIEKLPSEEGRINHGRGIRASSSKACSIANNGVGVVRYACGRRDAGPNCFTNFNKCGALSLLWAKNPSSDGTFSSMRFGTY